MATKTKRRKPRSLQSNSGLSRKVKHHRRRKKKGNALSELMSKQTATASAKTALLGGAGGFAYGKISPMLANYSPLVKGAMAFGISWLVGGLLKQPDIASGIAGGYGFELSQGGAMSEFQEIDYYQGLNNAPEYMDESGEPMYLAGDGQLHYLEEMEEMEEMEEGSQYLADYFPTYANQYS